MLEQIVGAAKKKPSAQEVNAEIWMQISNKTNHHDEKGRIALLFCCAKSKSLPYVDTSNLAIATTEQLSEQLDKMDPALSGWYPIFLDLEWIRYPRMHRSMFPY